VAQPDHHAPQPAANTPSTSRRVQRPAGFSRGISTRNGSDMRRIFRKQWGHLYNRHNRPGPTN